jgi:hypothetical protein
MMTKKQTQKKQDEELMDSFGELVEMRVMEHLERLLGAELLEAVMNDADPDEKLKTYGIDLEKLTRLEANSLLNP